MEKLNISKVIYGKNQEWNLQTVLNEWTPQLKKKISNPIYLFVNSMHLWICCILYAEYYIVYYITSVVKQTDNFKGKTMYVWKLYPRCGRPRTLGHCCPHLRCSLIVRMFHVGRRPRATVLNQSPAHKAGVSLREKKAVIPASILGQWGRGLPRRRGRL